MRFWKLTAPCYESDYKDFHINGSLHHPFSLPGVKCDVCGHTWGGSRVLPYTCPPALQKNEFLRNNWPIPLNRHKALQQVVLAEFMNHGIVISELMPGDTFQPCYLDIPSKPKVDFLWSSLESLTVSERVKNILMENCPEDTLCCKVNLRKVGKRESTLPAQIPESGEPSDIIDEGKLVTSPTYSLGPYYEVCIMKESKLPPECKITNVCSGCRRSEFNKSNREIRMTEAMWKGDQMFFLASTLCIVVTDRLKEIIESLKPTNVAFSEVGDCDRAVRA